MDREAEEPIQSVSALGGGEAAPVIEPSPNGHPRVYEPEPLVQPKKAKKPRFRIWAILPYPLRLAIKSFFGVIFNPIVLFLMTAVTTLVSGAVLAGSVQIGMNPFQNPANLIAGIPFAFTLLLIFFVHEMGHYLTAKRYGVNTTVPYFIPAPWFPIGIGTLGAVIRIKSPIFKKNALLDIGAAGPIAGFVVSIFAVIVGLQSSEVIEISDVTAYFRLGDSLIFTFIQVVLGKLPPEGYDIMLSPIAFAGWLGFFITAMNLLPVGQLDGGHIFYAVFGSKSRGISIGVILILVFLGILGWKGWFLWAFLCTLMGVRHPPVVDEDLPLDFKHRLVAIGSIVIFALTFMPNPFMIGP